MNVSPVAVEMADGSVQQKGRTGGVSVLLISIASLCDSPHGD